MFKGLGDNDSDDDQDCETDNTSVTFKKVAYWDGDYRDDIDEVYYDSLTHLIYGYLQFNADGSLVPFSNDEEDDFEDMIAYAQAQDVKIMISIGGDESSSANFNTIASSTSLTKTFVDNIIDFIDEYDLDGADLNWQFPQDDAEGELFEDLVSELSEELNDDNYLFSIAVISGVDDDQDYADVIDSSVFHDVDFVNIRAFNTTDSDDLHSSKQDAIDSIEYWTGRCLIQNKRVLGIPFFSDGNSTERYDDIVDDNTDYACVDESEGLNYNGIPTVVDKTEYAMDSAGGVMMQSLDQDAYQTDYPTYSLLDAINKTADGDDVTVCQ